MFENLVLRRQKRILEAEESRKQEGYGYDLTHIIRENLMVSLGLPLAKAQNVAERISDQAYYANWITVALPDGKWNTFKR